MALARVRHPEVHASANAAAGARPLLLKSPEVLPPGFARPERLVRPSSVRPRLKDKSCAHEGVEKVSERMIGLTQNIPILSVMAATETDPAAAQSGGYACAVRERPVVL
jgi:hypothetical protein